MKKIFETTMIVSLICINSAVIAQPTTISVAQSKATPKQLPGISIGPDSGIKFSDDGGDLLANIAPINQDYSILSYAMRQRNNAAEHHFIYPSPRLILSGAIEANATVDFKHRVSVTNQLSRAELDALLEVNSYINAYVSTGVNTSNGNLVLNSDMLTIGNVNDSPLYLSAGQYYVPFGSYATSVIDSIKPISVKLGAVHANAITLGYHSNNPSLPTLAVFVYKPRVNVKHTQHLGYGLDMELHKGVGALKIKVGVSFINNIANSDGMSTLYHKSRTLQKPVAGGDARLNLSYLHYGLLLEYTAGLTYFNPSDMLYQNHAARPQSLHAEIHHSFTIFNKSSNIALGITRTYQALALNIPKQRIYLQYGVVLHKNLKLDLELDDDINYSANDTARYANNSVQQDGQSHLGGYMQIGYYF